MASKRRNYETEAIYHIYNRGNHKERIFYHNEDYLHFIVRLRQYADEEGGEILAYCLMANHFHLLMKNGEPLAVSRVMKRLSVAYAKYHNVNYGLVGHVFQGSFGLRKVEDTADLLNVAAYIHRNPSEFCDLRLYRWSDYVHHTIRTTLLTRLVGVTPVSYEKYVLKTK